MLNQIGLSLLTKYISLVGRYRLAILAAFVVVTAYAVIYTVQNLGMNTDTRDMLSPELPWRQLDLHYEKHFPQFLDTILIVVESTTPDQSADTAAKIYSSLVADPGLFKTIYYPLSLSIFRENALLYLDEQDLYALSDKLAKIQPFLSRLTDDMSLRGLFNMISDALDAIENGDEFDIEPLVIELDRGVEAVLNSSPYRVSWQNLIDPETELTGDIYRDFILVQPVLNQDEMLPANQAISWLRELVDATTASDSGTRIRLTGSEVLSQEELLSVSRGTGLAIILSLVLVIIIMISGIRSMKLVAFTLVTLITGLILTAGFATIAIGELNLISVAFAVLYIGLGIDFAIHYTLRYREMINLGYTNDYAIEESSRNLGESLVICTITTAIGFFAFIPTEYRGVAELGLISGTGMFISLFVTLTLLPSLLATLPLKQATGTPSTSQLPQSRITRFPIIHRRKIQIIAFICIGTALLSLTGIRFDPNILNLQDPDNESVQTYVDLLESSETSPWNGVIVTENRDDALLSKQRVESIDVVEKVIWLEDFIPENQDEKLFIIDEMNLLLAGGFQDMNINEQLTSNEKFEVLEEFLSNHRSSTVVQTSQVLTGFINNLQRYLDQLEFISQQQFANSLNTFSATMLASLPGRLALLNDSLNAEYVSIESLPEDLKSRWVSPEGKYLISILPAENLNDSAEMRRFVEELYEVDPRLTGPPVINIEAGDAVIDAFKQSLSYAIFAIAIVLLLLLPYKLDTVLILSTLLFAVLITAGLSVLFNIPLNFANIIALPLLLGIGVDSAIHILHRFRTALPGHENILATSSARAVIVSTFTTMGSIGNLAFSPHTGTASMGKLLTMGIAMTLVATLVVLPGLLSQKTGQSSQ